MHNVLAQKGPLSDLAEEIESHVALEADQLQESGKARGDVRTDPEATARRSFGNVASVIEAWYRHGRWVLWDQLSRDIRQAVRMVRRRPRFSAVVMATLALGIGANRAIFTGPRRYVAAFSPLTRKPGANPLWS